MTEERRGRATSKGLVAGSVGRPTADPIPSAPLRACGNVYVTLAAAERYATFSGQLIEGARKELTALLLDARMVRDGDPSSWRARSRATGLDISATVVREGGLMVVVASNVRNC